MNETEATRAKFYAPGLGQNFPKPATVRMWPLCVHLFRRLRLSTENYEKNFLCKFPVIVFALNDVLEFWLHRTVYTANLGLQLI